MAPSLLDSPHPMVDVLIVEDEAGLRESLLEGLSRAFPEHSFAAYGSVEEAHGAVEAEPPQVVISDIRLPGQNGVEFLQAAKRRHPTVRFILMTAYAGIVSFDEARNYGALCLLRKPFALGKLVDAVKRALDSAFSGSVEGFSLMDLLQLVHLSHKTLTVVVHDGRQRGELFFEEGDVVHAEVGDRDGLAAFKEMIGWQRGDIETQPGGAPRRTISLPFPHLALEAARQIDEEREGIEARPHGEPVPESMALAMAVAAEAEADVIDDLELAFEPVLASKVDDADVAPTIDAAAPGAPPPAVSLRRLRRVAGFLGACLVDSDTGDVVQVEGGHGIDLAAAGTISADVVRSKQRTIDSLALADDVEDIIVSLPSHYHLLRYVGGRSRLFVSVVLDRRRANLALAREELRRLGRASE